MYHNKTLIHYILVSYFVDEEAPSVQLVQCATCKRRFNPKVLVKRNTAI